MTPDTSRVLADAQRVLELSEKATAGPWIICGANVTLAPDREYWELIQNRGDIYEQSVCDSTFIAHARTFAPEAARHIIASAEREAKLREALKVARETLVDYANLTDSNGTKYYAESSLQRIDALLAGTERVWLGMPWDHKTGKLANPRRQKDRSTPRTKDQVAASAARHGDDRNQKQPPMSINMTNPATLVELIDAASNYVAQIRLATMIGDRQRVEFAIGEAERLLSVALEKADKQETPAPLSIQTPRVDSVASDCYIEGTECIPADLARDLEREIVQLSEEIGQPCQGCKRPMRREGEGEHAKWKCWACESERYRHTFNELRNSKTPLADYARTLETSAPVYPEPIQTASKGGDESCAPTTCSKSTGKSKSPLLPRESELDTPPRTVSASDAAATSDPLLAAIPIADPQTSEESLERIVSELEAAHPNDLPLLKGPQPLP